MAKPTYARRWQTEALSAWLDAGRRGVIEVVTGAGKTVFAGQVYQRVLQDAVDARLVIVVPTLALLDQWAVTLISDLGFSADEVAIISGETPRAHARRATVVVLNTARKRASDLVGDGRCLFVVDECHRAGSPHNAQALAVKSDWTLGLSATPRRQWDDGFENYVEPTLGPVIYEYGYAQARLDGLIPDLEILNYKFALQPAEAEAYEALTKRIARRWRASEDARNDPLMKRLLIQRSRISAGSPARVVAAVAVAERFPQRGLVFHEQIRRAETMARLLDKRGVRVALYHSGMGSARRRHNLELFKLGQITKLVTCRALDEGLNVPDAEVAILAASTTSQRQRIQRMGRVLRVTEGKKQATICTLFATDAERRALDEEAEALDEVAAVRWFEVKV